MVIIVKETMWNGCHGKRDHVVVIVKGMVISIRRTKWNGCQGIKEG